MNGKNEIVEGHALPEIAPAADGGSNGDGNMEARIARIESDVEYIKRDITDIKADIREIRGDIRALDTKFEAKFDALASAISSQKYWYLGAMIAVALFFLALLIK
jgi:hypothetical protein